MRLLGYPDDHRLIAGQLKEIEALGIEEPRRFHVQPCVSPVWDTALAVNALLASGLPGSHPALVRAADWLLDRQVLEPGDWQVKRPGLAPGGWAFQFDNPFYPDLDDTAVVAMGLAQIDHPDDDRRRLAIDRAVRWLRGMQGKDGGWASFDTDQTRLLFNNIPFADHGALLDPADRRPHRALHRVLRAARDPARRPGDPAGPRVPAPHADARGRLARALGRELPLRDVVGPPGARGDRARRRRSDGARAVRWLEDRQNADGGWGETCDSYADAHLKGRGASGPSQTAWALLGLMAAGQVGHPGGRARHRVPPAGPASRRRLGRPALERHGLSPGLLPPVPPLRPLLPAVGARSVAPAHAVEPGGSPVHRPASPPHARFARPRLRPGSRAVRPRHAVGARALRRASWARRSSGPSSRRSRSARRSSGSRSWASARCRSSS